MLKKAILMTLAVHLVLYCAGGMVKSLGVWMHSGRYVIKTGMEHFKALRALANEEYFSTFFLVAVMPRHVDP